MERSMLSDIPAHEFQAILDHLSCQDYASLRQVSRSVAQMTTQHVPYITLRLSCTSSSDQLQKWSHATRQLQHVNSVHIHVLDSVKDHVFDSAVQLLSHPARVVKELHLIGVTFGNGRHFSNSRLFDDPAAGCEPVFVPTLLPLQHLMGRLQTLVVKGIVVGDAPRDCKQWAAAAATGPGLWQLQSLTWNVPRACSCSLSTSEAFTSVTQNLTGAFPQLRQLSISVPPLEERSSSYPYETIYKVHPAKQLSMVQALATAVMQLKSLELLTVTGLPDIWPEAVHAEVMDLAAGSSEGVAVQPAAPVTTLDDFGCWLLQHHSQLKEVQISTDYTGVCMFWQKQHRVGCSSDVSSSSTGSADIQTAAASVATLLSINASVDIQFCHLQLLRATHSLSQLYASPSTHADSNESTHLRDISSCVIRQLSRYSSRPYVDIWSRINSLRLVINDEDLGSLVDIVDNLKSLKQLEVAVQSYSGMYTGDRFLPDDLHPPTPLSELMAAVAGIKGLQSLTVHVQYAGKVAQLLATDTLLLPLTAAAGGPGSSLKRLVLSGVFVEPTATTPAQVEPEAVVAASNTAANISAATTTTVEPGNPCRWFSVLRRLDRLQELTINHGGDEQLLEVSADSLPASLKVFKGRQLNITCAAHYVGKWPASAGDNRSSVTEEVLLLGAHNHRPTLQVLDLRRCRLCDPDSLASEQLQQLTVIRSSWPGAWAAAATAWPNIQKINWKYDSHFTTTDGVKSSNNSMKASFDELTRCNNIPDLENAMAELAKEDSGIAKADSLISMMLQDIFVCFKHLSTLSIMYLPWVSAEILQPVVHHMQQLRYARFDYIHKWYMILHDAREHAIWDLQYANDRSLWHLYRPQPDHSDEAAMRQFAAHALPSASLRVSHVRVDFGSYGILL